MTHAFLHNLLFYSSVSNSNLCKISLTIPASSIKLIPKHFLPASFKDAPTWYAFVLSRSQSDIRNPLSLLAHNRITAPQFIRRGLYPSWYKQIPTHCLLLFATPQGTYLIWLKCLLYFLQTIFLIHLKYIIQSRENSTIIQQADSKIS